MPTHPRRRIPAHNQPAPAGLQRSLHRIDMHTTQHADFSDFDYDYRSDIPRHQRTALRLPSFLIATQRVHIDFNNISPPSSPKLRRPEFGTLAKRRVSAEDRQRDFDIARASAFWRMERPRVLVIWGEVNWDEPQDAHPGDRVRLALRDGEVSPKTVPMPEPVLLDPQMGPWRRLTKFCQRMKKGRRFR